MRIPGIFPHWGMGTEVRRIRQRLNWSLDGKFENQDDHTRFEQSKVFKKKLKTVSSRGKIKYANLPQVFTHRN